MKHPMTGEAEAITIRIAIRTGRGNTCKPMNPAHQSARRNR